MLLLLRHKTITFVESNHVLEEYMLSPLVDRKVIEILSLFWTSGNNELLYDPEYKTGGYSKLLCITFTGNG